MANFEYVEHNANRVKRQDSLSGTAHAAGDYALHANFGTTAALTVTAGSTDMGGEFTVTCGGTGQGANPTVVLTFKDGAFPTGATAKAVSSRSNNVQPTIPIMVTANTTTTLTFTFCGTASGTEVYKCRWQL